MLKKPRDKYFPVQTKQTKLEADFMEIFSPGLNKILEKRSSRLHGRNFSSVDQAKRSYIIARKNFSPG